MFALSVFSLAFAAAAVNCTLDHPDQDIRRIFPDSTSYRVRELIPFRHGEKEFWKNLAKEMDDKLDPEFETPETPYTFYVVYKGEKHVGLVLGTNTKGVNGLIQGFVAYEPNGKVRDVYFQKISSAESWAFRSKYYRTQFKKFGINSVLDEAYVRPPQRVPSKNTIKDHHVFVRSVRLNNLLVKLLYNKFKE